MSSHSAWVDAGRTILHQQRLFHFSSPCEACDVFRLSVACSELLVMNDYLLRSVPVVHARLDSRFTSANVRRKGGVA